MPRARTLAAALGLVGLAAAALLGPRLWAALGVAPAYTAKILCSCVFVSGRDPAHCRATDLAGLGAVRATVDREAGEVRAKVFGLRSARAGFRPGRGCTLH